MSDEEQGRDVLRIDPNAQEYDRDLEWRYLTEAVFHSRTYAAARVIESDGPWQTIEDAAMAILEGAEDAVPTVDQAYHDVRMDAALKRAIRAETALARVRDPDPLVLTAAVTASLAGVNLTPVPIEVAVEEPCNRKAVRRALKAAVDKVSE